MAKLADVREVYDVASVGGGKYHLFDKNTHAHLCTVWHRRGVWGLEGDSLGVTTIEELTEVVQAYVSKLFFSSDCYCPIYNENTRTLKMVSEYMTRLGFDEEFFCGKVGTGYDLLFRLPLHPFFKTTYLTVGIDFVSNTTSGRCYITTDRQTHFLNFADIEEFMAVINSTIELILGHSVGVAMQTLSSMSVHRKDQNGVIIDSCGNITGYSISETLPKLESIVSRLKRFMDGKEEGKETEVE